MRWYYLGLVIAVFMTSSVLVWLPSLMMRMMNISEVRAGLLTDTLGLALACVYGICAALAMPAIAAISQDVVPVAHKGLSMGLAIFAQYMLGGAWGPYIVGFLSDRLGGGADGLGTAVMLCGLFGIAAGVLFYIASRTYPEDLKKVTD